MGKGKRRIKHANNNAKRARNNVSKRTSPKGLRDSLQAALDEDERANLELMLLGNPGVPNAGGPIMAGQRKPIVDYLGNVIALSDESKPEEKKQRVTLMRDHTLKYPELFLTVYLSGPAMDQAGFPLMFARAGCQKAVSPELADLVVFTGGADVDPQLYGEVPHKTVHCNPKRDDEEIMLYLKCVELGIPMLGVCRGAQFLHVMNGGKLFQHVDGHYGDHTMLDIRQNKIIDKVSSVHHQMVIPQAGMSVIATNSGAATERFKNPTSSLVGKQADVEAFFYRDTCCIGIQGHPEYANYNYFTIWSLNLIEELVNHNPDVSLENTYRRLKAEFIAERDERARIKPSALPPEKPILTVKRKKELTAKQNEILEGLKQTIKEKK